VDTWEGLQCFSCSQPTKKSILISVGLKDTPALSYNLKQKGDDMPQLSPGFDDAQIAWQQLPNADHLWFSILDLDEDNKIIDVLIKLAANEQVFLHRHTAPNNMIVLKGEHRLYEADGTLKEVRPTGRYTASPASDEPHREGGGEKDAIILFSIRSNGGTCYEILDDEQEVISTLGFDDFKDIYAASTLNSD
jgi:hypothetical protein